MPDGSVPAAPAQRLPAHARFRHGLRRPQNWMQLIKFSVVGGSGYAVNLSVFTFCVVVLSVHHLVAAAAAFVVAVLNNFWWNRHWTFRAGEGHAGFQAARFFTVSIIGFVFSASILELLVSVAGAPKVASQAISIVCATPITFIGNKMWTFNGSR